MAAAFVLLGGAQLAFWWWEARLPKVPGSEEVKATEAAANPFSAWTIERAPEPDAGKLRQAQRLAVPVRPQNIQFGDAMAGVVVTIFTDPSCGPCREQVRAWTATLPVQGVKQVYKFWPAETTRTTPGMLVEMARRQGVVGEFWRAIHGAGSANLDDSTLLTMLDRAGVPLATQRTTLLTEGSELMSVLEADMAVARDAKLPPPPVIMVDDYVMDGEILKPENVGGYVKKRLEGRQLFEKDDLWLMRK